MSTEAGQVHLPAAREQRDALDRREGQLQSEARALVDQLAERDVAAPPAWARETFGERPDSPRAAAQWDRGVRAVARYRVEQDMPDEVPALGPEPADQRARAPWRQAERLIAEVQQRLDRGAGLER